MEDFLLVVIGVVLFIRWLVLSNRMRELNDRVRSLETAMRQMHAQAMAAPQATIPPQPIPQAMPATPPPIPHYEPVAPPAPFRPPQPAPQPTPYFPPPAAPAPAPVFAMAAAAAAPAPAMRPAPLPRPPAMPPGPTLTERLRKKMSGQEWEALVGGNLLLKLGMLMLVIGVALFLGYSFTQMGPAGRVAISLAVCAALLGGGIALERRPVYKLFGRALLAGGWAALYFTSYAMYAVQAAKVIASPIAGSVLLLAVATGMIIHSLKYRSQTVTALAYFIAFATLAITPVTAFSVVALVPLAASLLYISYRFQWSEIALFGLVATYGTCVSRGDSGAPAGQAQIIFSVYWFLFEAFDVLRAWRKSNTNAERFIMPLNVLAFCTLSFVKWSKSAPDSVYAVAAGIATAYLISAVARMWLRPPSSFTEKDSSLDRIVAGGYEAPITLTAALFAAVFLLRLSAAQALAALLVEGELFFIAGLLFREAYPRWLAAGLFTTTVGKLCLVDLADKSHVTVAGMTLRPWTLSAIAASVLFYVNRGIRRMDKAYAYAGSAVMALVIGFETPERFLGMAYFAFASLLFVWGWFRKLLDFRIQSYAVGALGVVAITIYQADVATGQVHAANYPWIGLACAAALAYAAALTALRSSPDRFAGDERSAVRTTMSWALTVAMVALIWKVTPGAYLGIGWIALAIPALELGIRGVPSDLRESAYVVAGLGAARVLFFNAIPVRLDSPLPERAGIAIAALLLYAVAARIYIGRRDIPDHAIALDIFSLAGTGFLVTSLWALLPIVAVGPSWAMLSLALLEIGFALNLPRVRLQAHAVAGAAFGRLMLANFDVIGTTAGISQRLLTVVPVIGSQYYAWSRRSAGTVIDKRISRFYPWAAAVLTIVLMRFELGRSFAAAGWALFALGLVAVAQRIRDVDLRWQSLIIAALAFLRSWTTDFWSAGFGGNAARVGAGALVVASLFAAQLLMARRERARLYFSLLATVLLTVILFHEVSGRLLTMAWGAEGVALLVAGFPLSDRNLRLSGLALFLICILKLFVYDLRELETLYRILSFIVLGLILVSVSWVYTRFRDRLQRYL